MKIKLGVICGGMSSENEVSVVSANSIIENLNNDKYDIYKIYIDKNGSWFYKDEIIDNVFEFLSNMDVLFPVLHGLYGEDGSIQGLFELIKKPYVGCKILASAIGMDKVYSKILFKRAGINVSPYAYIKKYKDNYIYVSKNFDEEILSLDDIANKIVEDIKFPMFVKPSNEGSSVGISKVRNLEELKEGIEYASKFDNKILIEEGIVGQEVECAVLGNHEVIASTVGEIVAADDFYSYDAKYNNSESKTLIPALISEETMNEIRKLAIKAFKAIDGKGLSRVDFFIEKGSGKIIINEINTLPGFTSISMYPKLFKASGISYTELLDRLIELAMEE